MTAQEIKDLRELESKATQGRWDVHTSIAAPEVMAGKLMVCMALLNRGSEDSKQAVDNANLIAAMRNTLPALLDAAEELTRLQRIEHALTCTAQHFMDYAYRMDWENWDIREQLSVLADENASLQEQNDDAVTRFSQAVIDRDYGANLVKQLQADLAASQEREKSLAAAIREANSRFETWIEQPTWTCEEYNDFTTAWEAVMQALKCSRASCAGCPDRCENSTPVDGGA